MSKAVLISIQPKWCELIAKGIKTVEVRKTKPKLSTPFKVYIYCTKAKEILLDVINDGDSIYGETYHGKRQFIKSTEGSICDMYGKRQKVIGEFVCDAIISHCEMANADIAEQQGYIKREELLKYAGEKEIYGWHISDLVIYDNPKELGDFQKYGALSYEDWLYGIYNGTTKSVYEDYLKPFKVIHAPQSWCYVEE